VLSYSDFKKNENIDTIPKLQFVQICEPPMTSIATPSLHTCANGSIRVSKYVNLSSQIYVNMIHEESTK
jgi:hypothetical protein